jgi:hypothetical protein
MIDSFWMAAFANQLHVPCGSQDGTSEVKVGPHEGERT